MINAGSNQYLRQQWSRAAWVYVAFLVCLLAFYFPSFQSMADIWFRSDTFAHGVLIPFITLWLVYRSRHILFSVAPTYSALAMVAMCGAALFWLLGRLMNVLVVEQMGAVLLLIFGTFAIVGLSAGRVLLFPLCFLMLMVPMGEELIEPMMDFTAMTTVWLVRSMGIPVFREGLYFSLPSGNWSVVEACSGVRYLIASFALGLLYAYITYQSLYRRFIFVSFSIFVPIIANSLRAFMIVMIGHHSGMKYAVGVDHLIYGWVFFGIVIFLMFWVGSFFSDIHVKNTNVDTDSGSQAESGLTRSLSPLSVVPSLVLVSALVMFSFVPDRVFSNDFSSADYHWIAPEVDGHRLENAAPSWEWAPKPVNPDIQVNAAYEDDSVTIGLYANHYLRQAQGAELVNGLDLWVPRGLKGWRVLEKSNVELSVSGKLLTFEQALLSDGKQSLLVWRWYRVAGRLTADPYLAKIFETIALIDPNSGLSSRYYLATPANDEVQDAEARLLKFAKVLIPQLSDQTQKQIAKLSPEAAR